MILQHTQNLLGDLIRQQMPTSATVIGMHILYSFSNMVCYPPCSYSVYYRLPNPFAFMSYKNQYALKNLFTVILYKRLASATCLHFGIHRVGRRSLTPKTEEGFKSYFRKVLIKNKNFHWYLDFIIIPLHMWKKFNKN